MPGLNRNDVYTLLVHQPEPSEQQRIAHVLDTVDEAIAKSEAVIAKLKQVRAGMLHDLLTCGLDENGELRDPIAHPEQFKDSPLGRIPKVWEYQTLEKYTISSAFGPRFPGERYSDTGNVALMRTTDMDNDGNLSLEQMPIADLPLDEFRAHLMSDLLTGAVRVPEDMLAVVGFDSAQPTVVR